MSEKSPSVTSNENYCASFSNVSETSDIRQKFLQLEITFNKNINRLESTWNVDMKSLIVNPIYINADKIIIINALPGIEALFLEKFRLCWLNFKTRFQRQITSNNFDYKSFCMTITNVEKELLSFDSIFNCVDTSCNNTGERKRLQITNNIQFKEPNVLYKRIELPKRMYDFETQRYRNKVIFLKSIHVDFCTFIGEGQLRIADSSYGIHLSEGFNFGNIELAINLDGNSFAVKKLSKNSEITINIASSLTSRMDNLLGLSDANILPYTHCIEYPTELWIATPVCDYNLETYIDLTCIKPDLYSLNLRHTVKQMVNGLQFLHCTNNGIVHGNMKPSNILIDALGNIRLADFGIIEIIYEMIQPRSKDVIWWSRETMNNYETDSKKLLCNKKTDIQTLGMIIHFTLTGGMHPFGNTIHEIYDNKKRGRMLIRLNNAEQYHLVKNCVDKSPSERPSIAVVSQNVFLWSVEKKWDFLMTCVQCTSIGSPDFENFSKCLDMTAKNNWNDYLISMGLNAVDDNRNVDCYMPSRFLFYISNDTILTMKDNSSDLRLLATSYLSSFPTLTFALVNLVKRTKWSNTQCFQQYLNEID